MEMRDADFCLVLLIAVLGMIPSYKHGQTGVPVLLGILPSMKIRGQQPKIGDRRQREGFGFRRGIPYFRPRGARRRSMCLR